MEKEQILNLISELIKADKKQWYEEFIKTNPSIMNEMNVWKRLRQCVVFLRSKYEPFVYNPTDVEKQDITDDNFFQYDYINEIRDDPKKFNEDLRESLESYQIIKRFHIYFDFYVYSDQNAIRYRWGVAFAGQKSIAPKYWDIIFDVIGKNFKILKNLKELKYETPKKTWKQSTEIKISDKSNIKDIFLTFTDFFDTRILPNYLLFKEIYYDILREFSKIGNVA